MKSKKLLRVSRNVLAGLALLAAVASNAATWTNAVTGTLRWGDNLNWSPNTFPNANDAVADFQINLTTNITVGVASATGGNLSAIIGTLKLGGTNGASAITINKGGASTSRIFLTNVLGNTLIEKRGDGNDTISVGTVWMNNMTINFAGGTGALTFNCGNANLTEQPALSARVLTVSGAGTLVFQNANSSTFSGGTVINQATVQIAADGHLGAAPVSLASSNVIIGNGGKLLAGATLTLTNRGIFLQSGNVTLGTATNNQTFTINGPITTDPVTPATLLLAGPGTVGFGGVVTPGTNTFVTSGTLLIGGSGSLTTSAGLYLASGSALAFDCPAGNLTSIPVTVGTLGVTNIVKINISGIGLSLGQFTLVQYGSLVGDGFAAIQLGTLPTGVVGHLVNTGTTIDFVVDALVNNLTWTGATDGNWDTNTLNWNPSVAYKNQYGSSLVGDIVRFDDSVGAGPTSINLTTALQPATMTVDNSGVNYSFSGAGRLTQTTTLTKSGTGTLNLQTANDYSGGSTLSGGLVQIGQDNALGSGAVNLNGSSVSSDSTSPHSLSNNLIVTLDTVFGDAINNGALTLGGVVDFLNASRLLRFDSDVTITGTMGNGIFDKDGLGTLTLKGTNHFTKNDHNTFNGTVVFDGAVVTNNLFGWRLSCTATESISRLVITNNGILSIDNSQKQALNMRVGNAGGSATSTNIVDLWSGQITLQGGTSGGSLLLGHTDSARGIFNLNGGTLLCQRVNPGAVGAVSEFNFNGGVLRVSGTNFLTTFMQDLTEANVRAGGAIVDTAGYDVTIAQSLLDAGGGLTKNGAGALFLNGTNTYTGSTVVNSGALGGTGVIAGSVLVTLTGALSFGPAISTLTINNSLTLQGGALLKITKDSGLMSDSVAGLTAITNGGTLVVTNIGTTELASGDLFTLFSATTYQGSFSSVTLPALASGLSWNTNQLSVNGTIQVIGSAAPPTFSSPILSGSNLILNGSGGTPGGTYSVLTSTNIALPRTNWISIATNTFDGSGNFSFTNAISAGMPQQFYLLQLP